MSLSSEFSFTSLKPECGDIIWVISFIKYFVDWNLVIADCIFYTVKDFKVMYVGSMTVKFLLFLLVYFLCAFLRFDFSGKCTSEALKEEMEEKRRAQVSLKCCIVLPLKTTFDVDYVTCPS